MFRPAVWISMLAWPTMVSRRPSPSIRGVRFCRMEKGSAIERRPFRPSAAELPSQQIAQSRRVASPSGLKNRLSLKWSLCGPL